MFIQVQGDIVVFRTEFSEKDDLIQTFRGFANPDLSVNAPIDFRLSGLIGREKPFREKSDLHTVFIEATDEATAIWTNGSFFGSNHGFHAAVAVTCPEHGKTLADVGSLWKDASGTHFTLMRVIDGNRLLFLSDNIGTSVTEYKFKSVIDSPLVFLENGNNRDTIVIETQLVADLRRGSRYLKKELHGFLNGVSMPITGEAVCEYAELSETYLLINPATVADELRLARPENGYTHEPNLADFGKPLFIYNVTYRVSADGTVLCYFDSGKLDEVNVRRYLGAMFQERNDVCGGGVTRFIPKSLPFVTAEGHFDFAKGVALKNAPYPDRKDLTSEYWEDPASPPDRIIDCFLDNEKNFKYGFACGSLPVYDGSPSQRSQHLESAVFLYKSKKAYPIFVGEFSHIKGVAYKKYFVSTNRRSYFYEIPFNGKTYIYCHFAARETLTIPLKGNAVLLEKSASATYSQNGNCLTVSADNGGYAVFVE